MNPSERKLLVMHTTAYIQVKNETVYVSSTATDDDDSSSLQEEVPLWTEEQVNNTSAHVVIKDVFHDKNRIWLWNAIQYYQSPTTALWVAGRRKAFTTFMAVHAC